LNPKLSLITICYNSYNHITRCLNSVSSQRFKDFEYIIIDGKSSDGTLEEIKKFKCVDKLISEPDNGIYEAFNKGIKNAKGEVIGFLNSDDVFFNEDSLGLIYESFDYKTDCVFGDLIYTDSKNRLKRIWKSKPYSNGLFKSGWMPAHPTFYCKKSIYEKYGLYNESYKIAGDFELMMRFLEKNRIRSKHIPKNIVNMRVGGVSGKSIKAKFAILNEEFRAFEENELSFNKLLYLFHKLKKLKELRL
jgi:glycosyltransferase involved in cell wall biosynthesis